jgi:hypothetical protein
MITQSITNSAAQEKSRIRLNAAFLFLKLIDINLT